MKTNLEEIKKKVLPILEEAGVTRSSLFGSYVRGEEEENSDIDMLVEVSKGTGLLTFVGLQHKLAEALADSYFFLLKNSSAGSMLDFCIADYDNFPIVNYDLWKTNQDNPSSLPDLSEEETEKVYERNVRYFLSAFEASVVPLINLRETPAIREEIKKVLGMYKYLDFTR